jgi:hypothetical protein
MIGYEGSMLAVCVHDTTRLLSATTNGDDWKAHVSASMSLLVAEKRNRESKVRGANACMAATDSDGAMLFLHISSVEDTVAVVSFWLRVEQIKSGLHQRCCCLLSTKPEELRPRSSSELAGFAIEESPSCTSST